MTQKQDGEEESSLKQKIDQDMKEALKGKKSLKLGVLRMLKSEIRYQEIEKGAELSNDEVISIISSSVKRRRDSIQQFEKGGRDDLVTQEKAELEVVLGYMPEQLTEEKLSQLIRQAVQDAHATGPSDLGKVMKLILPQVKGKADGKVIHQLVTSQLQSLSISE